MTRTTRGRDCPTCGAAIGTACRSVKSNKPMSDYHASRRLFSVNEAVQLGYTRLRKPHWSSRFDHFRIDIVDGALGPWVHLFSPMNKELNGRDPVDLLVIREPTESLDNREFEVYRGHLPDSDQYKAEVARFSRQVERTEAAS